VRMAALTRSKRLTECEIYLNKAAVKDIVAWIKARSAMEEGGCPACLALEPRIKNEENPPSQSSYRSSLAAVLPRPAT
jgi:hypothetical protein